ncbi:alpha/beta fold hydrolase [Petropleomorpha daqingensis]|uniref:Pimeloyl-ACP methyl ester carboxylesterase n=1 Tax=Petropleomorpha daqingensis TaxID=2026353 RepID=A0A853CES1_9ACTN|nr:alpha/beta fold hydrolase [Petropleomorpha daqingensis]NYJ05907.1 pimeloyl-ACP methyl ester carboxylesterase [Petropleomorpha daqingensis]
MSALAHSRSGSGAPLVLLHALGLSRASWAPVLPALAEHFDVVAVDLPGFGDSPPLAEEPSPKALAAAVAAFLDEQGLAVPHVVGNSLGGWVALELAALRPLASLTLLSPAGMWPGDTPLYCRVSLRGSRWLSVHAGGLLSRAVDTRVGRIAVLGQTHGRPTRLSPAQAKGALRAMATAPGFDAVLAATLHRHYAADAPFTAPVTVAFGDRDRLLIRRRYRRLHELPPDRRVADLPGCGHVPMADDPAAVAALVLASAGRGAVATG